MKKAISLFLILLIVACKNKDKNDNEIGTQQPDQPKNLSYSIVNSFPHDTSSFTQGLLIYKGELYESTGGEADNANEILKVDLKTGKVQKMASIDRKKYFGEGIAILRDTVYQLTWKDKVVFVYTLKDFKKVKEFTINTEGWGITTDGKDLIVSDGTSNLYYYDPSTFKLLKTQAVTEGGSLTHNLNELEFIDGFVYANQWQYPYILKIDPASGKVVAKGDLNDMWNRVKAKDPEADVPNGIAYDPATKKIYVTGKLWPNLYEIQFAQ
ncbi:MAG: glutaminyl-peptide cyclotransferase [Chitinophagaceae bacterium]|jgi:glutamine cyclotransferase|nr:glutaminyl-peptide cyclotransferase [Chitinophagaceae bacterium]OQY94340.1 MAG: glutamine cyclotransferase [Sphingobacteriales bacterium UTBCD1]